MVPQTNQHAFHPNIASWVMGHTVKRQEEGSSVLKLEAQQIANFYDDGTSAAHFSVAPLLGDP